MAVLNGKMTLKKYLLWNNLGCSKTDKLPFVVPTMSLVAIGQTPHKS